MRGARDLTWSYASFLEAARSRDQAREAMTVRVMAKKQIPIRKKFGKLMRGLIWW